MDFKFYDDTDVLWAEFKDSKYAYMKVIGEDTDLHFDEEDGLIRAIFLYASKGVNLEDVPCTDAQKKEITEYLDRNALNQDQSSLIVERASEPKIPA